VYILALHRTTRVRRNISLGRENLQGSQTLVFQEIEVLIDGEVFAEELLEGNQPAILEPSHEPTIRIIGEIQTVIMKLGIDELSH
jgi:hypothetical protein